MSSHHEDYREQESGEDVEARDEAGQREVSLVPEDDPEELRVTCRTRSLLPAEPDIVASKVLTVTGFRSAALDLRLGSKVSFNPGIAPQACAISPDDAVLLPSRYVNLAGAGRIALLQGRVLFQVDLQDPNRPGVLAFRLKFEEQRIQPKRAVILATIDLRSRTVLLARG